MASIRRIACGAQGWFDHFKAGKALFGLFFAGGRATIASLPDLKEDPTPASPLHNIEQNI
jgi:hypothetical protein